MSRFDEEPDGDLHGECAAMIHKLESDLAAVKAERDAALVDARRYQWLRDVSVPPHNFYLSVPVEFADTRYEKHEVDAAIDAAIASQKEG